jgi:hypothetical protein
LTPSPWAVRFAGPSADAEPQLGRLRAGDLDGQDPEPHGRDPLGRVCEFHGVPGPRVIGDTPGHRLVGDPVALDLPGERAARDGVAGQVPERDGVGLPAPVPIGEPDHDLVDRLGPAVGGKVGLLGQFRSAKRHRLPALPQQPQREFPIRRVDQTGVEGLD